MFKDRISHKPVKVQKMKHLMLGEVELVAEIVSSKYGILGWIVEKNGDEIKVFGSWLLPNLKVDTP